MARTTTAETAYPLMHSSNPDPAPGTALLPRFHRVITRHPGAAEWITRQLGHAVDVVPHLELVDVEAGGCYYGVIPLHLAAAICAQGSACWAIEVQMPPALRGQELSIQQLDALGARLVRYAVQEMGAYSHSVSETLPAAR